MALARVVGSVCGAAADLLIGRDLGKQLGQDGRIAHVAAGELGSPDFQRLQSSHWHIAMLSGGGIHAINRALLSVKLRAH